MTTTNVNGRAMRKSLAEQIDRLDGILNSLNQAVAGAVCEAVGLAVKQAVAEVLLNKELLKRLQPGPAPDGHAVGGAVGEQHDEECLLPPIPSVQLIPWKAGCSGMRPSPSRLAGG